MRFLARALGRLDPWAALLLGVLVTLALVILLATPGPWHKVVPIAPPASISSRPPEDIAVFVRGDGDGGCIGVVWLHVDHRRQSLTATVLPPRTEGRVDGGGRLPLHRIVDDIGPKVAVSALAEVLGVDMEAWFVADSKALQLAVAPMYRGGDDRPRLRLYTAAAQAWETDSPSDEQWYLQYATLEKALPQVSFGKLNVVTFANYVLGFGVVQNELDLQSATSLAQSLTTLRPSQIRIRALPARVERSGQGETWHLEPRALEQLSHSLAVGLTPSPSEPDHVVRVRPARVLVVLPKGVDAPRAYADEVRRRLQRSAGAPVAVRTVSSSPSRLAERAEKVVAAWRPLAVLVAPVPLAHQSATLGAEIEELCTALEEQRTPVVLGMPPRAMGSGTSWISVRYGEAAQASGVPISNVSQSAWLADEDHEAEDRTRRAARANVETLVRACWPDVLAPDLPSTRLGYRFAAAQRASVAVLLEPDANGEEAAARLRRWGYEVAVVTQGRWVPELPGPAVYYRKGMRRPALALAGDWGLGSGEVVAADSAPADVALVLREPRPSATDPVALPSASPAGASGEHPRQ